MLYDYEDGYALNYTNDTVKRLNDPKRGPGRVKIRFDVVKRDGKCTIVHHDLTYKQVGEIRAEITRQGNKLL